MSEEKGNRHFGTALTGGQKGEVIEVARLAEHGPYTEGSTEDLLDKLCAHPHVRLVFTDADRIEQQVMQRIVDALHIAAKSRDAE